MKNKFEKVGILFGSVILAIGLMFLFFGGTWKGVRFGLEIFGVMYIIQISYSQLIKAEKTKKEEKEADVLVKKHFYKDK